MKLQSETGPKYPGRGSKITGDPTPRVALPGTVGCRVTGGPPASVGDQAVAGGRTASGNNNSHQKKLDKPVLSAHEVNGIRQFSKI